MAFENSNPCVQIKSCDNIFETSYSVYHKFEGQPSELGWGKHSCFTQKRQVSNISRLLCFMLTYSKALV